jgi:hypothetical protein
VSPSAIGSIAASTRSPASTSSLNRTIALSSSVRGSSTRPCYSTLSTRMTPPGRILGTNSAALAEFYSRLTRWRVVFTDPDWYSIGQSEQADFHLSFQRLPGHQQPSWPDPASSM